MQILLKKMSANMLVAYLFTKNRFQKTGIYKYGNKCRY